MNSRMLVSAKGEPPPAVVMVSCRSAMFSPAPIVCPSSRPSPQTYSFSRKKRSRLALVTTVTEDRAMAALANIGSSSQPVKG